MFLPKYETEKLMAESYYSYYPHYEKINNAMWDLFEKQEHLWLSDIETMAVNLSVDIGIVLGYISLITESDDKPQLLTQLFYQVDENGQLKLIDFSLHDLLALTLITIKPTAKTKNNKLTLAQEALNDWLKSTFTCWQPIDQAYKPILDATFNNPSNSLWAVLQNQ
jgi:hypothetical protein